MKNKTKLPFLRTENLVVKELPNELLIYDLEKNKAFCLNETARLIMDECDGKTSIDEATESLSRKLKSKVTEDMVWMVVEQFEKSNFLKGNYEIPVQTSRVSRRKILQTAAALGIALPIVTSLVAPTAIHAQSGCIGQNGECIIDRDVSGCCENLECVEIPDVGAQCIGCVPLGQTCQSEGGASCCEGFCINTESGPTGFTCVLREDF
jgi:Coenzyme PQQ synthesis protein D (PqqD)